MTPTRIVGFQSAFEQALLSPPDSNEPTGHARVDAWRRQSAFAVYRNTVQKGCLDALRANHPSVAGFLGQARFANLALGYVRSRPPSDVRLPCYGEDFGDFIAALDPGKDPALLRDLARLDRLWIEAHTAADAEVPYPEWLSNCEPDALAASRLVAHPAARWLLEPHAAQCWWQHRPGQAQSQTPGPGPREGLLFTRPLDAVQVSPLAAGACAWLNACAAGATLEEAAVQAERSQPDAPLASIFEHLLRQGALVHADPSPAQRPS